MTEPSPLSPEARLTAAVGKEKTEDQHTAARYITVVKRTAVGVYSEGFVYAGNFAYLSLLAVFSFFIVAATLAGLFGRTEDGVLAVEAFLRIVPPSVAEALRQPIEDAMGARTGPLLWMGAAVSLWTTASLIETIRDILHRAYGVVHQRAFWEYRLRSIGLIIVSVFVTMLAFSAQVMVIAIEEFIRQFLPWLEDAGFWLSLSKVIPFLILFVALYLIFLTLTPRKYRPRTFPKWPGAALTSLFWMGITAILPLFLKYVATYKLTYGSLAGIIITLIFFYLVGLAMVIGAELNAALAETGKNGQRDENIE